MKYTYFLLAVVVVFVSGFVSDNLWVTEKNDTAYLTSEVEEMAFDYLSSDTTSIKIEPNYVTGKVDSVKVNTTEMLNNLNDAIEKSFTKTTVKTLNQQVGVIKSGTCGTYPTLVIFMDCEDDIAVNTGSQTRTFGWVGDNVVDDRKNISMSFCVVSGKDFGTTSNDYAVLMLNSWGNDPGSYNRILRNHDNEDNGNANYAYVLNNGIFTQCYTFGDCVIGNREEDLTKLYFLYFPGNGSPSPYFPNYYIKYGVFGRFGPHQGLIWIDDEDHGNANQLELDMYNLGTNRHDKSYPNSITNILDGGNNTRYFVSKVTNCHFPN